MIRPLLESPGIESCGTIVHSIIDSILLNLTRSRVRMVLQ